jgi:hypothetical protein
VLTFINHPRKIKTHAYLLPIYECSISDIELRTSKCNSYSTDDFGRFPSQLKYLNKNGKDDGECHVTFPVRLETHGEKKGDPVEKMIVDGGGGGGRLSGQW